MVQSCDFFLKSPSPVDFFFKKIIFSKKKIYCTFQKILSGVKQQQKNSIFRNFSKSQPSWNFFFKKMFFFKKKDVLYVLEDSELI